MLGVTGDLAKKKLIPAVYRLHARGLLEHPRRRAWPDRTGATSTWPTTCAASLEDTGEKFDNKTLDDLLEQLELRRRATTRTRRRS